MQTEGKWENRSNKDKALTVEKKDGLDIENEQHKNEENEGKSS